MNSFCHLRRVDFTFSVFGKILKLGHHAASFTNLLKGLCLTGRTGDALQLFDRMVQDGEPHAASFNALIKGLCLDGRTGDALQLFDRKVQDSLKPDGAFITLIEGLCLTGRTGDALQVFDRMVKDGLEPLPCSYETLIYGLCKVGHTGAAIRFLRAMEETGWPLDEVQYTTIIVGLCKDRHYTQALNLFFEMDRKLILTDITSDVFVYNSLLNGACSLGTWNHVKPLLKEMIDRPDVYMWDVYMLNIMVDALCKRGRVPEARDVVDMLTQKALEHACKIEMMETPICCFLVQLDEAAKVFGMMAQKGCARDVSSYNTLINAYCKTMDKAIYLFKEMCRKELIPNTMTYNTLTNGLCHVGRLQDAIARFYEMVAQGQIPNVVIFEILLEYLCKDHQLDKAMHLVEAIESSHLDPNRNI